MVTKVIDVQERRNMSKRQEQAVVEAFESYGGRTQVQAPRRFSLGGEFVEGYCCKHDWEHLNLSDVGMKEFLKKKFDETELGNEQKVCSKCKAFSLWENGSLFAYDAIVIEEEKVSESPKASRRPGRR
jgi:hypothetical protein